MVVLRNDHSIAWGDCKGLHAEGRRARLTFKERFRAPLRGQKPAVGKCRIRHARSRDVGDLDSCGGVFDTLKGKFGAP